MKVAKAGAPSSLMALVLAMLLISLFAIVNNWHRRHGYRCYGHGYCFAIICRPRSRHLVASACMYVMRKDYAEAERRVHQVLDDCGFATYQGLDYEPNKTFAMHWVNSSMTKHVVNTVTNHSRRTLKTYPSQTECHDFIANSLEDIFIMLRHHK